MQAFARNGSFYAPAYLHLLKEQQSGVEYPAQDPHSSEQRKTRTGKLKALWDDKFIDEFNKERTWLLKKLEADASEGDRRLAEQINENVNVDDGIECGCCFSNYPFVCLEFTPGGCNHTKNLLILIGQTDPMP